jgi:hypothetical protein
MTTRVNLGVVALLAVVSACEPRPPLPQGTAAAPTTAAPQPPASALAPSSLPATRPPPRSNCGLATPEHIELMPVFHQRVVVQKQSLGPVKLRGTPRLIAEPEDFAEYYLGESAIDPKTVPAPLQALRGAQLHVLRGSGECKPKLGAFSAFAWADEEGAGWSRTSPAANAARVFRKGESFLVAQLEPNCEIFGGLVTVSAIDGYRWWDKVIDEPDSVGGPTRRALFQQALATLPEGGANLPRTDLHWTQATLADASLLVLELQTGSPQPTFLRVWCVETDGSLVPLGPGPTPPEHSDAITHYRHHIDFIGREGSLPIILYSYFGLEPSTGRYTYFNPAIGPAPHI